VLRKACAVLCAAVLFLALAAEAAFAFTPAPGPLFNNPRGTQQARQRILHNIIATIGSTPRFSTIQIAAYSFDRKDIADALIAAHRRAVNVQLVLNDNWSSPAAHHLERVLGTDPDQRSFVSVCHGSCRGGAGNQHMKFYLFTKAGRARNVVMTGSANPTGYAAVNQWNDMYTVVNNRPMLDLYSMVFEQLARDTRVKNPFITKTIGTITNIFYPHPGTTRANDPVMQRLDKVRCAAPAGTGSAGHTVIRIIMYGWVGSRGLYLADKVADLDRAGCDVRVILSSGGQQVVGHLQRGGVLVKSADLEPTTTPNADNGETYLLFTHEKWMILDGGYADGDGAYVWTGSENWSNMSVNNDEVDMRIHRRQAFAQYRANFDYIWTYHSRWL